ncbi:hypothetical protein [Gordonia sihwensis]|uniref:hypothetical protein n=1 Tax=Gordonia sihwensis TaxID=173559 RepID=UPI003D95ECCA
MADTDSYTAAVVTATRAAIAEALGITDLDAAPTFTPERVGGNHTCLRADLSDGRTIILSNGDSSATWNAPTDPPTVHLAVFRTDYWDSGDGDDSVNEGITENALDPESIATAAAQALAP